MKYSKAPERHNILSDKNTISTFKFNPVVTCWVSASFVWLSQNYNDFCSTAQKCNRSAKGSYDLNLGHTQQQGFRLGIIYWCLGQRTERKGKNLFGFRNLIQQACNIDEKTQVLTKTQWFFFFLKLKGRWRYWLNNNLSCLKKDSKTSKHLKFIFNPPKILRVLKTCYKLNDFLYWTSKTFDF